MHVAPDPADSAKLARLVASAHDGAAFEIDEGVYGPIVATKRITIAARAGADAQAVHIVGSEQSAGITVRGGALTLRGLMVSSPEGDGIDVQSGAVTLEKCLVNTPRGAPITLPAGTSATLDDCYVGGGALRVDGGLLRLEESRFGHASGKAGVLVSAGRLDANASQLSLSTVIVAGATATAKLHDCLFEASVNNALEVRDGATVELVDCRFRGGFLGVLVERAKLVGQDLLFAEHDGRFVQMRGALRLLRGATATLASSFIRGSACLIAGASADGLVARRKSIATDKYPRVAIVIAGGSRLECRDVVLVQEAFSGLYLDGKSVVTWSGGELRARGEPVVLEGTSQCTLRSAAFSGTKPPLVANGARLSLLDTKLQRTAPGRRSAPKSESNTEMPEGTIVDAKGKGHARSIREAIGLERPGPILVRAGRYRESIDVREPSTIIAEGEVVWEAERDRPCVTLESGRLEVRGVTFKGKGSIEDTLVITGGALALQGCRVENGRCLLRLDDGVVEARACSFERSNLAGLIACDGTLTLRDCTIADISNKPGHGLQATETAKVIVERCTFRGLAGHAIYATEGKPIVDARDLQVEAIARSAVCVLGSGRVTVERLRGGDTGEQRLKVGEQGKLVVDKKTIRATAT